MSTHEAGGMGVEAGVTEQLERMQTGPFKIFRGQERGLLLPARRRSHREEAGRSDLVCALRDHDAPLREAAAVCREAETET
jgi:hypothetical protein